MWFQLMTASVVGLLLGLILCFILPGGVAVKVDGVIHNIQIVRKK